MRNRIFIFIIIILLAALAVVAFEKYRPALISISPSPSATFSPTPSEINPSWNQYQDTQNGFSIAFPPDYLLTQNSEVPASDISLGQPAATLNIPDSYFTGTNLGEASLTVRVATSSAEVAACAASSSYLIGHSGKSTAKFLRNIILSAPRLAIFTIQRFLG